MPTVHAQSGKNSIAKEINDLKMLLTKNKKKRFFPLFRGTLAYRVCDAKKSFKMQIYKLRISPQHCDC